MKGRLFARAYGSQKHLHSYVNALKNIGIHYSTYHLGQKEFEDAMK